MQATGHTACVPEPLTTEQRIVWTARRPSTPELDRAEYEVFTWEALRRRYIEPAQRVGTARRSQANPAQELLDLLANSDRIAVMGVTTSSRDLREVYGYLAEPAYRRGCRLLISADAELADLSPNRVADPGFGYPWTLERLRWLVAAEAQPDPLGGVVQIIAPAGSGKTTALIARVKELLAAGVPPQRILCTAFNAATRRELARRLDEPDVAVHTFHSLGWHILGEEGLRKPLKRPSMALLRRIAVQARQQIGDGEWVEPHDAAEAISQFKLVEMADPADAVAQARAAGSPALLARATIYELYQAMLDREDAMDHDDQLRESIRLLQSDPEKRRAWQDRWHHVLVDEYQDIEPAQELLIQTLAAPHDSLFAVGDEDQCLYAWRRASVERIIGLDQTYPGLERRALETNYRCPEDVVRRSTRLIEHNQRRFPKTIIPARGGVGSIAVGRHQDMEAAAVAVAELARDGGWRRGDAVVLARSTRLLRGAGIALARAGVRFDGPDAIFKQSGALGTLEAYLRLLADLSRASADDVQVAFRVPNRNLPAAAVGEVTAALRAGGSFAEAVAGVQAPRRQRLDDGARLLDELSREGDASAVIQRLRSEGGLDDYYGEYEQMSPTEQVDTETLESIEAWAVRKTIAEAAAGIERHTNLLLEHRDPAGLELSTIHGAKGREWPEVVLFGCDDTQLPHHRSLETAEDTAGAIEDERRIAYVAFTRTMTRLHLVYADEPSRFLVEAGLAEGKPKPVELPPPPPPRRRAARGPARARAREPKVAGPIGALIVRLESNSIDERRAAAADLAFQPVHPAASAALAVALADRDARVRQTAAVSLGRVGTSDALPALERRLTEESEEFVLARVRISMRQIEQRA